MKAYGIATRGFVMEHGGSFEYQQIAPYGSYYSGPFPPVFTNKAIAEQWLREHPISDSEIVELEMLP